ncbi:ATP synthase regulation protein NCA2-domain-containing protein [Aspergillus avenaceus]|uniref:ATP synthase regulation protein NCA2-domain-containing protein n=1 Tax=Aspergillus avenaceus TaxID=36643 RepID=A0A5N6TRF5_ASPAV|nr:ATP synthase regulation protein NCA2-domain-containing protein [Aspergillus avenaceus]
MLCSSITMSVINNNIRRIDVQFDKAKQQIDELHVTTIGLHKQAGNLEAVIKHMSLLEDAVSSLSVNSKSRAILHPEQIGGIVTNIHHTLSELHELMLDEPIEHAVQEFMWLVVAKAAVQTLGVILQSFLDRALALNDEISYWDSVLVSPWYTILYTIQIFPYRIWHKLMDTRSCEDDNSADAGQPAPGSHNRATKFNTRQNYFCPGRSQALRTNILSPFITAKFGIKKRLGLLRQIRNFHASSIGLLIEECFPIHTGDNLFDSPESLFIDEHWHTTVFKSVDLMGTLLQSVRFDSGVFELREDTSWISDNGSRLSRERSTDISSSKASPGLVAENLHDILFRLLPAYKTNSLKVVSRLGRPSCLVRYWLPISTVALSASTLLRILTNHRHELVRWATNFGTTAVEFWCNWVIDPIHRLIGTIKHDETSEIALMSRNSLEADRASLERMVIDFILDRGHSKHSGLSLNIDSIAEKVREGDLTPVLRAYEKDLRSPFAGTVRGDLVRALLIQIQKTKVDVEIAIGGIDALLKSQELVFGFVGLTPGILVSYMSLQWLYGLFGNRKGLQVGRKKYELRHALRNIHRTLTLSASTATGLLTSRDHGLLICDAEVLLRKADLILRGADRRTFQEDLNDLVNQRGIDRQFDIIDRMSWTHSEYIRR